MPAYDGLGRGMWVGVHKRARLARARALRTRGQSWRCGADLLGGAHEPVLVVHVYLCVSAVRLSSQHRLRLLYAHCCSAHLPPDSSLCFVLPATLEDDPMGDTSSSLIVSAANGKQGRQLKPEEEPLRQTQATGGKGAKKGKKKGSGRRGGAAAGAKVDTTQLLQTLVKATLANAQANRDLAGALFDVAIILKEPPEAEAVAAEGRRYSDKVRGNRDHQLGPPHAWMFGALLKQIHSRGAAVGMANAYDTYGIEEKADEVQHFQMVQTYGRTKTRIVMAVERTGVRSLLLGALVQLGAERKVGRAPRAPREGAAGVLGHARRRGR